ncbi:hypothetical protein [Aquimarina celericrescens]|uniref:DUF2116 family Zn-ribbon domain-containing protein n=1 Tax=Aquimarina celericrescens TaxID=1964542 RepID=A0ABW5AX97_9FLAO
MTIYCLHCNSEIEGRIDKKFCTPYCRSAFHYQKNKENENTLFKTIDKQLKTNRRILKNYNKAGLARVSANKLLGEGFNPKYFTHLLEKQKRTSVFVLLRIWLFGAKRI